MYIKYFLVLSRASCKLYNKMKNDRMRHSIIFMDVRRLGFPLNSYFVLNKPVVYEILRIFLANIRRIKQFDSVFQVNKHIN